MPRISPFQIVLSREEIRELTRRADKYTLPYFQVVRAKIILLAAEGWANNEIAATLHTRREIVSLWRKRFYEERLPGLEDSTAPGPAPGFSPQTWSFRSRRWRVSGRRRWVFPCRASV